MKKNFVLIAALIAALTVAFVSCGDDGVVAGTGEKTPAIEFFATVDGLKTGISAVGSAKFDATNGFADFSHTGATTYGDGSAIRVDVKGATDKSTITITYVCRLISGSPAKVTLKNPLNADSSWIGDDAAAGASDGGIYKDLKVQEEATLVLKGSGFVGKGAPGGTVETDKVAQVALQRGDDKVGFQLKILKVEVKD